MQTFISRRMSMHLKIEKLHNWWLRTWICMKQSLSYMASDANHKIITRVVAKQHSYPYLVIIWACHENSPLEWKFSELFSFENMRYKSLGSTFVIIHPTDYFSEKRVEWKRDRHSQDSSHDLMCFLNSTHYKTEWGPCNLLILLNMSMKNTVFFPVAMNKRMSPIGAGGEGNDTWSTRTS